MPGKLAARVAGAVRTRDGYGERRDFTTGEKTAETGNEDSASWRAALSWTPREDLDARRSLDGVSVDEKGGVHHLMVAFFATCPPTGPIALVNCFTDPDYGRQWYHPVIGSPSAWDTTTGSTSRIDFQVSPQTAV